MGGGLCISPPCYNHFVDILKSLSMRPEDVIGFRNLDAPTGTIAKAMESRTLFDYGYTDQPGLVALAVTGRAYSDEQVLAIQDKVPEGQVVWAFSPVYRKIGDSRLKVTHVRATTDREFALKVSHHIANFIKTLPSGTPLTPARLPFPDKIKEFSSSEQYVPLIDERHTVRKYIEGVPYEFFSDLRTESKKLVVFGQSAVSRSKVKLPYFFRWTWSHRIDASVMIWNDPTLYLDSKLDAGWWIGSRDRDYIREAMTIIERVRDALGIENSDVLFVGLSAGGMSAIPMATHLPGSHTLVENPRVTMLADGAKGKLADVAVSSCLGYPQAKQVPSDLLYRIDTFERILRQGHLPDITYLQNMLDEHHVDGHYRYFRDLVETHPQYSSERHKFIEYEQWNLLRGGHFPLKEPAMLRVIHRILQGQPWDTSKMTREEITAD